MKVRLFAAVVCTALSFMALWVSVHWRSPLFLAAWAMYLWILVCWVRRGTAPRALVALGAVLGVTSVLVSAFVGLLWAAPAIALMLHISWRSLRPGPAEQTPVAFHGPH